jgi:hypothetical protein
MENEIKACLQMENLRAVVALIALRLDLPAHRARQPCAGQRVARLGLRWQSAAATPLLGVGQPSRLSLILNGDRRDACPTKAAWCCASRRSP